MTATRAGGPRRLQPPEARAPGAWSAGLAAVVRRGLLDRRRSVIIWGGSVGALGAFMAAIYPSIRRSIEQVAKSYPAGLKHAFGVEAMNTVEGYVHAELFSLIVPLALAYFVIRAVAGSTVGAEEAGYLDTVLALPISRRALMVGTYIVSGLACAGILILTGAMTFVAGRLAGTGISFSRVTAGVLGVLALALFVGGVAALAAGALRGATRVTGLALGTVIAMYALDLAGQLARGLEPVRWVSAFRYYDAPLRDGLHPAAFLGLSAAGVLLMFAGAVLFERRDLRS